MRIRQHWRHAAGVSALFIAVAAASAAVAACPPAHSKIEYSAVKTIAQGGKTAEAKVFAAIDKERHEPKGLTEVVIYRTDRKVEWMLLPEFKRYGENDLNAEDMSLDYHDATEVGQETVESVSTHKCQFEVKFSDGALESGTVWISDDGVLMKRQGKLKDAKGEIEYSEQLTQFKVGAQDPRLFEIPADFNQQPLKLSGIPD